MLGTQNLNLLELNGVDAEIYKRARAICDRLLVTVDFVVSQYAYYRSLLGDVPPAMAVEDYAKRHKVKIEVKTVAEAVAGHSFRRGQH